MDLIPRKIYLDDIFDDFISSKKEQLMKCDIYEKEGDYHIEMDIPGFSKEDISLEVNDGYLKIKAEKSNEIKEEDESKNYLRRERSYGKVERSFYLADLEEDRISAEFTNGMLKIVVPKKEEKNTKKIIDIK